MRRRQLVNLKISDVDFSNNTILLSYEGSKTRREWIIPLHDELSKHLKILIEQTEVFMGRKLRNDEFIFDVSRVYPRYVRGDDGKMQPEAINLETSVKIR